MLIGLDTHRGKPVEEAMDAVNYNPQSVLQTHDLNPRKGGILEELGRRGDQSTSEVARGRRRPDMHSPIPTRVPDRTPHPVLQKVWKVGYVTVHYEVRQFARIRLHLPQQLQTSKRHVPVVNGRVNKQPRI